MRKIIKLLSEFPFLKVVSSNEGQVTYVGHGSYVSECFILLDVKDEKLFLQMFKSISVEFEDAVPMTLSKNKQFCFGMNDYYWNLSFWNQQDSWEKIKERMDQGRRCLEKLLLNYILKHEKEWK